MDILEVIFTHLSYWTTTLVYWFYSLLMLAFDHYRIAAGILVGILVIYKIFFDK